MGTPTVNPPPPGIALFDLDGTLLPWDCQLLFRDFVTRRHPWRRVFVLLFLLLAPLAPLLGTARMKRVFLAFLWRMPEDQLAASFRDFADSVMPLIYPEVRDALEQHRAHGHLLILASASPEGYVREIGTRLGFDISLGTVVHYGPLFPDLVNHKGRAKVARLHAILPDHCFSGDKLIHCHGYSDSSADLPMLALCDAATAVNPDPHLESVASANGWNVVRPHRPWTSKTDRALRSLGLLLGIGNDPAGRTRPQAAD